MYRNDYDYMYNHSEYFSANVLRMYQSLFTGITPVANRAIITISITTMASRTNRTNMNVSLWCWYIIFKRTIRLSFWNSFACNKTVIKYNRTHFRTRLIYLLLKFLTIYITKHVLTSEIPYIEGPVLQDSVIGWLTTCVVKIVILTPRYQKLLRNIFARYWWSFIKRKRQDILQKPESYLGGGGVCRFRGIHFQSKRDISFEKRDTCTRNILTK